jgi:uncharacterized membrane protein
MAHAGHDALRIEAFSDAVFGFAITLLVVSLEVPASFDELMHVMRGLPVFAVTFAILLMIWQEHHNLFKRFPSGDGVTIWLNGALLFVVVSYIYPLKFLFTGVVGMRFGEAGFIRGDQMASLMILYGAGFSAIFLIFAAMYWRAARRATDPMDRYWARVLGGHSLVYVGVAVVSMLLAASGSVGLGWSGIAYALIGPFQRLYHALARRFWKPPVTPTAPETAPG